MVSNGNMPSFKLVLPCRWGVISLLLFSYFFPWCLVFKSLTMMCLIVNFLWFAHLLQSLGSCLLPNLGSFQPLFPYELFKLCSFLLPHWTSIDKKGEGIWLLITAGQCWEFSPHIISVTTGKEFHYHSAGLKVPAPYSALAQCQKLTPPSWASWGTLLWPDEGESPRSPLNLWWSG